MVPSLGLRRVFVPHIATSHAGSTIFYFLSIIFMAFLSFLRVVKMFFFAVVVASLALAVSFASVHIVYTFTVPLHVVYVFLRN